MLPALAAHLRTGDPSVAPCPTPLPTAATSSTPKKVRLALVGCGQICQTSHWPGIAAHAHPYIEVTAVVDTLEENAVTLAGLIEGSGVQASRPRVFTDLDEALAADGGALFDAVDVMLPHHLHRPVAEQCFAAGRHVCLEKPMAHQLEDAEAILRAAAAAESAYGCVFFMAEQSQFWPEVLCAKALIDSGAIGQLLAANCRMNSGSGAPSDEPPAPLPPHAAWRASRAQSGGGVIMDGGAHWIRPLRMIMGEIEEVTGQVRSEGVGDPRHEGEQFGRAMFRHVGGLMTQWESSSVAGAVVPDPYSWRFMGTQGEIGVCRNGPVILFNAEHPDGVDRFEPAEGELERGYSFGMELCEFGRLVLHGEQPTLATARPMTQPEHSLAEMRTAKALYKASETGRWEPVF